MPQYRSLLDAITPDRQEIPQNRLNIDVKERSNLFAWNGQFSPQFIDVLLQAYAPQGTRVLDPFSGSGTVLHECARYRLDVTGIELNPAAHILAKTYVLCTAPVRERESMLAAVAVQLTALAESGILAARPDAGPDPAGSGVKLRTQMRFLSAAERALFETLIILSDFYKNRDLTRLRKTWARLHKTVLALPYSDRQVHALLGDGRYPPATQGHDLVLTSPPYVNVYNYHQQYRASAEALGWNLLEVARTEIGSNRKNRGNRFLTVIEYCLDLALVLENLWDATTGSARQIFVLGRESRVRGIPFFNGEIFARLAVNAVGYSLLRRQEREFTNRFGQRIHEDIIHIGKKGGRLANSQARAGRIAKCVLEQALALARADDVAVDLEKAILAVDTVRPSPGLNAAVSPCDHTPGTIHVISDPAPGKTHGHAHQRQVAAV